MNRIFIVLAIAVAMASGIQAQAAPVGKPATSQLFWTCGTLVEALSGPGDPRYVLAVMATPQIRIRVRLVGQGTAPSDLMDQFSRGTPQVVTISGTEGVPNSATPDAHTITNFTVTRVANCTMPNTSTNAESAPSSVRALPNTSTSP